MDGLSACDQCCTDQPLGVEIAVGQFVTADANTLIGERNMSRIDIGLGVDRNGGNAHFLTGTNNPDCDLSTVCHKNFRKHRITPF